MSYVVLVLLILQNDSLGFSALRVYALTGGNWVFPIILGLLVLPDWISAIVSPHPSSSYTQPDDMIATLPHYPYFIHTIWLQYICHK